jgi:anthranilate synthase component 1
VRRVIVPVERLHQGVADIQLTDIDPLGDVTIPYSSNFTQAEYEAAVKIQRVHSSRRCFPSSVEPTLINGNAARPFDIARARTSGQPVALFVFYLKTAGATLIGSSRNHVPGREWPRDNTPLGRDEAAGQTAQEDDRLAAELRADPKERAEAHHAGGSSAE